MRVDTQKARSKDEMEEASFGTVLRLLVNLTVGSKKSNDVVDAGTRS